MTQNLYQQNKYLQQFSYMVSHNLRAPAANVMGLASILCSVDRTRMFDETLSRIKVSADTLDTVIRDMNHILSIRGNSATDKKEVNLAAVCGEALSSVRYQLNGCQHAISVNIDHDLNLMSNKGYLLEIMRNLFCNAVKFRKANSVLRLDVSALQEGSEVELVVQDNGIGMDMDSVKNDIFKLYKKFHKGYEGRGLNSFLLKRMWMPLAVI